MQDKRSWNAALLVAFLEIVPSPPVDGRTVENLPPLSFLLAHGVLGLLGLVGKMTLT